MATYAERLAKVQAAIDSILMTGQAISQDGQQLTHANLDSLRKMEKDYQAAANREAQAGKGRNRIIYVKPQ